MTISPAQHRVLLALAEAGRPVGVRALGRQLDRSSSTVMGRLLRLQEKRLVENAAPFLDVGWQLRGFVGHLVPLGGHVVPLR